VANNRQNRLFTSVRPARVAVLIDQSDEDWHASCQRIIEFLSTVWGGGYNVIIPTDGTTIMEEFWDILTAFDPDYLYFYYKTGADLKINHPDRYEDWLEREFRAFAKQGEIDDVDSARRQIDELLVQQYLVNEPSESLQAELIQRLAPFHIAKHAIEKRIAVGSTSDFPLSLLTNILKNSEQRPNLSVYEPKFGGTYTLWISSVVGLATAKLRKDLLALEISATTISANDYDTIELLIDSRPSADFRAQNNLATPFELANINTSLYRSTEAYALAESIVVIVGETLLDFCLYYSLKRLRNFVFWLPQGFLKSQQERPDSKRNLFDAFADGLKRFGRYSRDDARPKYVITSQSQEASTLESLIAEIDRSGYTRSERIGDSVIVKPEIRTLLRFPLRLYERDNVDRPSPVTIDAGSQIDFFETPKPKTFIRLDPYENRWITEVNVHAYQLPRNPLLGSFVVRSPLVSTNGARIGSSGICYFCPTPMFFGGDIDTTLIRPSLFIPNASQVFEHLFRTGGYDATLSDKGFFARDAIEKFGDLSSIGALLRNDGFREVLLKFLDHTKTPQGTEQEGVVLNDKRRYLNLPSITRIVGTDVASQTLIEALVTARVLSRGFVFKCRVCRNADWFGLDEISQSFRCKRCDRTQIISNANYWYASHEPGWFYKLDEIVYQFLRHNGYVTLLALDNLRAKSKRSFLYTTDLELSKTGTKKTDLEMDILCIQDGKLTIGEAKKEGNLGLTKRSQIQEIEKYFRVARLIGADSIVFATFASSWSENTIRYIKETLADNSTELMLLAADDLLGKRLSE
jgi:hypothetical protein